MQNDFSITSEEYDMVKRTVTWSNRSWYMLVGSIASVPLTFALEDGMVGGLLAIASLTGWSIFQGNAAFAYGDLLRSQQSTGSNIPDYSFPRWSHVFAAGFGVGAITGAGMIFNDDTGAAVAITATASVLSWITGIAANISTYNHSAEVKRMIRQHYGNRAPDPVLAKAGVFPNFKRGTRITIPIFTLWLN
jgi:hypothetical protein